MAKSFKQMIKDGEVRRADAMKVQLEDLHEEPGFNLRLKGEALEASIDALAEFIANSGQIPPLKFALGQKAAFGSLTVTVGAAR